MLGVARSAWPSCCGRGRSDGARGAREPGRRSARASRFVRRRQAVLGCMTLDMFAVIFGGATALLPIFATDILHVGARGYGLLTSSLEIGALLDVAGRCCRCRPSSGPGARC